MSAIPTSATNELAPAAAPVRRKGARYQVLGPGLKKLLWVIFGLVAVLGSNSAYLAGITFLGWWYSAAGQKFEHWFYPWMILFHIAFGLVLMAPVVVFAVLHWRTARHLPNRRAFRMGQALFATALIVFISGILLTFLAASSASVSRAVTYWLHVISPLVAIWLYVLHRLAGPPIRWRLGAGWVGVIAAALGLMVVLHAQDPRKWNQVGPQEGEKYFFPALARTLTGNFISERAITNDAYCKDCHPGIYERWENSAHRGSSFNNPAYAVSVRETRKVGLERDNNVKASRFCAGCHDPAVFFSGQFDNPEFDDVHHPTSQAGITCTVCHSITAVNSDRGNADYTIEEAIHYPFAFSENSFLKSINHQLIKAKPSFHKKTFLKPVHKSTNFCGACHKVHLPEELNHYKWLRGQNHFDSFFLSGASGIGARSFYYPEKAHANCNGCHMPLLPLDDPAAKLFAGAEQPSVHDHFFPGANTALPHWRKRPEYIAATQVLLKDCLRVDIFGLRAGTNVTGELLAPLRAKSPELKPGQDYVIEVVIRNLKVGHHFTQGTADSNEAWLDVTVRSGDRVIGRNGAIDDTRAVDPWSYFLNAYVLDRHGNRIDRRNAQDIFVPLYDHQIPPGSARLARFGLKVPANATDPVTIDVKVQYRKFDQTYLGKYVFAEQAKASGPYLNDLPITLIASDQVTLPVVGGKSAPPQVESPIPLWQRWNDYGIAQLLEAQQPNIKQSDLRTALLAFGEVEKLGFPDGPLNQARVHLERGYVTEAEAALRRATEFKEKPARRWTLAWLWSSVLQRQGRFDAAENQLRSVLEHRDEEMRQRNFDFSRDYMLINQLGDAIFERSKVVSGAKQAELRLQAVATFERVLTLDPENLAAHYNLNQLNDLLAEAEKTFAKQASDQQDEAAARKHQALQDEYAAKSKSHFESHAKYKPDENARDKTVAEHRKNNPAANHAASAGAIHPLHHVQP